jgi:type I restriction enzyme R subunit
VSKPLWNEDRLSERPAAELLQALGYTYVAPEALAAERSSPREVVLVDRLAKALRRLNPWLSEDNVSKAVRAVANVQAASLLEANEEVYTTLVYGQSFEQDRGDGRRSHTVQFLDFDQPDRNELLVTRQFDVQGTRKKRIPDVVVFVNGIPLVVIECKSPTIGDRWLDEAVDQLRCYQELDDKHRGIGIPRLFQSVQLVIATCDQAAIYAGVGAPQRVFAAWKDPYPLTLGQVAKIAGRTPTPQDILLCGLLAPENLLDLVRNFVVFERDRATGRVVKKVPRYQQFAAVNKAIARAAQRKLGPAERGGVVWHTQGSGKSLTMLWLALKLRRDPTHENPTIVLVTDRRDLDDQIASTFRACGYPSPEQADSIQELRKLLAGPGGSTVMTTVQKFQEAGGAQAAGRQTRMRKPRHPVLSEARNVFVLTDEAHRTQYGSLAANLRQALPNAVFFGFTGTPIDKQDRSTLATFGPYIDQYTIEQAVADGATVPIFYEGRLPELRIVGSSLEQLFDRMFADRTPEEREAIKKRYATAQAIAEAPKRIQAICLDLIDHYQRYIQPGGFKAQIVAVSRDAAVTYQEMLETLHGPPAVVVMSGSNKDEARLMAHHTRKDQQRQLIADFLDRDKPPAILIVCDMLITGFDAPIEQVMYLDSPLKEHTLLQAIARVNRPADGKKYGLVVDYWGVSENLQEALAVFAPGDVQGAMTPRADELPRLQARHAEAMRFFERVADMSDLTACVNVLEPEDVRAEFQAAFRRFAQSMDMMLPDPRALEYLDDLRWLGQIRLAARARFRGTSLDISDCGDKVRKLIEDAIVADGMQILVKEVSLFSADFEAKLKALGSDEARASEMEHALRHEIHVKLEEDPAYYRSLRERLEQIIADRKARRLSAARQLELLQGLVDDTRGHGRAAESVKLTPTAYAIYGALEPVARGPGGVSRAADRPMDRAKQELAASLEAIVSAEMGFVDWTRKDDVKREMRRKIKRLLKSARYEPAEVERLAGVILELLERRGK